MHKLETGVITPADLGSGENDSWSDKLLYRMPFVKDVYRDERAACLEWMCDAVRLANKPLSAQDLEWNAWSARVRASARELEGGGILAHNLVLPLTSVTYPDHVLKDLGLRTMIVLLAVERFRLQTGHWPGEFGAMDKTLLTIDPSDPFGKGKPLRLLLRDGGFVVYSLSFNRKDDQGAFPPDNYAKERLDCGFAAWDPDRRRQVAKAEAVE